MVVAIGGGDRSPVFLHLLNERQDRLFSNSRSSGVSLAVTGRTHIPPRKTGRVMKNSTGSKGNMLETVVLRTSRVNGDAKSTGDRLECGMR